MLFLSFLLFASEIVGPKVIKEKWDAWYHPPVVSLIPKNATDGAARAKDFGRTLAEKHDLFKYQGIANIGELYTITASSILTGFDGVFSMQATTDPTRKYTVVVSGAKTFKAFADFLLVLLDVYENRMEIFKKTVPTESSPERAEPLPGGPLSEAGNTSAPNEQELPDEQPRPVSPTMKNNTQGSQGGTPVHGALIVDNQAARTAPNDGTPNRNPDNRAQTPPTEPRQTADTDLSTQPAGHVAPPKQESFCQQLRTFFGLPEENQGSFYQQLRTFLGLSANQPNILMAATITVIVALVYKKWPTLRKWLGIK